MLNTAGKIARMITARINTPSQSALPSLLRELMNGLRKTSAADLGDEQALRANHQDPDDAEQRQYLGHGAGQEELEDGLRLGDRECRGDRTEQIRGATEGDHQERIDDVQR